MTEISDGELLNAAMLQAQKIAELESIISKKDDAFETLTGMHVAVWAERDEYKERWQGAISKAVDEITERDRRIADLEANQITSDTIADVAALHGRIAELEAIVSSKLHQRRCWTCGHVFWAADGVTPYCLCERCQSGDTRRLKQAAKAMEGRDE